MSARFVRSTVAARVVLEQVEDVVDLEHGEPRKESVRRCTRLSGRGLTREFGDRDVPQVA